MVEEVSIASNAGTATVTHPTRTHIPRQCVAAKREREPSQESSPRATASFAKRVRTGIFYLDSEQLNGIGETCQSDLLSIDLCHLFSLNEMFHWIRIHEVSTNEIGLIA
jgi:hypothetical protein